MRINEAAREVGCTQRAIKHYEEKGLLPPVSRSDNGYRDYSEEDLLTLHRIQAYTKLGIPLKDIRSLLAGESKELLSAILQQKKEKAEQDHEQILALESYLADEDPRKLNEAIDHESIAQAIRAQLPGPYGAYIADHFAPYLRHRITTPAQEDAYQRILDFWDDTHLRLPLLYRLTIRLPHPPVSAAQMDAQIQSMLTPTDEEYEQMKARTLSAVRLRRNPLIRYSPAELIKRSMMRSLKDCGYYDIFIPAMKDLSPEYRAYHDALRTINDRLCRDLGLYYDADFTLRLR
ncbi:MAG: MerR family transcriptional regulator [Clostridia bacterium]|nr:MerR family transcriptional regulator [Clostridia bacterium]